MEDKRLSIKDYPYKSWGEKFTNYDVDVRRLHIHSSWNKLFNELMGKPYIDKVNKYLSHALKSTDNKVKIYPYPDLVFNAFNLTPLDKVKVVVIGQDPYHNSIEQNGKIVPQAMGLSFSVPVGITVPSSLKNIYKNQIKYKLFSEEDVPNHGNLEFWAYQGCLLLNTSLTVQHGHPNSHAKYWTQMTDDIIKYLSKELDHIVFVLWGGPSLNKLDLIDTKKHMVSISSHPSGLSVNNKLRQYESFINTDHFTEINNYLTKHGKSSIIW